MQLFAMSDIHGCLEAFEKALSGIDLDNSDSKLILLGDYCDRGPESLGVFKLVMELQERYGGRVIALRGNHEEMLLEYVDEADDPDFARAWMLADSNLATAKSFLEPEDFKHLRHLVSIKEFEEAYRFTVSCMKVQHDDVIKWIRKLPYYYESGFGQIFVHAGIDEEADDLWKVGTPAEWFTAMPPMYAGQTFDLDVIAGHIDTASASSIPSYRGIWHDGASHYYIDANVLEYGEIAVLRYDSETGKYSGPGLD